MIAKSLRNLANGVAGGKKKAAENGRDCDVIPVGRLNSGSRCSINQARIRRGQIKMKMFKMIAKKSLKDLSIWVAEGKNKATGNRGCNRRCFRSPATVISEVTVGEFKPASDYEIKQYTQKRVQIKNQDLENGY